MKVIYIAGPYRDKRGEYYVHQNIRAAEEWAQLVWGMDAVALCPHLNTRFFGGLLPDEVWLKGDKELLRRCDAVMVIPGWELSAGTTKELDFAKSIHKPMFFTAHDLLLWLEESE